MKKLTRCKKCGNRVKITPVGFTSKTRYFCSEFKRYISLEDGCTFGHEGDYIVGTEEPNVYLSGHEKVNGYHERWEV